MDTNRRTVTLGLVAAAVAGPAHARQAPAAQADLGLRKGATRQGDKYVGGAIERVTSVVVPAEHTIGDDLLAYEGVGWESDKVGYRLYLDERLVTDVFGKRRPEPVLHRVGRGDDYHALSDWGMDVLKVGESLGVGGLGVLRGGKAERIGKAERLQATVVSEGPREAAVRIDVNGFMNGGQKGDVTATYRIRPGSRLTHVDARATPSATVLAAGIVKHPNVQVFQDDGGGSAWAYVATLGVQSLNNDTLGLALFWPTADASSTGDDGRSLYVGFKGGRARYAFGAVWALEPGAPSSPQAFEAWLKEEARGLGRA
jgi:hypothetical protein